MGAIVILLLEDSDLEAERIFLALSEGGPECSVRRARTGEGLAAILTEGPVDLIPAGGAAPGLDVRAILDVIRARFPAVPLVAGGARRARGRGRRAAHRGRLPGP